MSKTRVYFKGGVVSVIEGGEARHIVDKCWTHEKNSGDDNKYKLTYAIEKREQAYLDKVRRMGKSAPHRDKVKQARILQREEQLKDWMVDEAYSILNGPSSAADDLGFIHKPSGRVLKLKAGDD